MNEKTTFRQKVMQAKGKKGFTLVELVIVIAVLAIIAFIAIPTVSHVIENANSSADTSNAQAIETAIKTAQSECAANATTHSDHADTIINAQDKVMSTLLKAYGVDPDVLSKPKTANNKFWYNKTTGKVVAKTDNPGGSEYLELLVDTKYVSTTTKTGVSTADNPIASTITIDGTATPAT